MTLMRLVVALTTLALGCAPTDEHRFQQEPITDLTFLPAPNADNPVAFGAKLHDRPALRAEAVAQIASVTRGRLPGVRFMVLQYPVYDQGYGWATSFRNPAEQYVVLSWKPVTDPADFKVQDASWEIEHMVAGTDDQGKPLQ